MGNLGTIRGEVSANLNDAGLTFYDESSLNEAINDAYQEIASKCFCIVKSTNLQQQTTPYYDFLNLGIADYLGTIGIFNLDTNYWLRDDLSLRDYDRLRRDWEVWAGTPQFWTPHSLRFVALAPNLATVTSGNQLTLWYWAQAPQLVTDSDVPLIASDMQSMLEDYATADRLLDAEEISKAADYLGRFERDRIKYKRRCLEISRSDLLLRI